MAPRRGPTRVLIGLVASMAALVACRGTATAQEAGRLTLVVPLAAGGAMDTIVRVLGARLQSELGRTVVVENRTGGGTITGTVSVARATPDGNTLLVAPSATLTTNGALYKQLSYDPIKDFVPVALYAHVPFVLIANAQSGVKSINDLVAAAKAQPGKLTYASTGVGTTPHLAGELLKAMTDIDIRHVPYRGSPPALNDLVGGHVQLAFGDPLLVQELIESGKVAPIGVSSATRMAALPKVPTLAETGLEGFEATSAHMVMAPAATPLPVVGRLNAAVRAFARDPEVAKRMTAMGMMPVATPDSAEIARYLAREIDRWSSIVRRAGIAGSL